MHFTTTHQLDSLIDAYFAHIEGEFHLEEIPAKGKKTTEPNQQKVWDRLPEPPTISGLILFLGFESRAVFDQKESGGRFAPALQRARLRIAWEYEKKLHQHTHGGAVFALKNLGWNDKDKEESGKITGLMKVSIDHHVPALAGSEREVEMQLISPMKD